MRDSTASATRSAFTILHSPRASVLDWYADAIRSRSALLVRRSYRGKSQRSPLPTPVIVFRQRSLARGKLTLVESRIVENRQLWIAVARSDRPSRHRRRFATE